MSRYEVADVLFGKLPGNAPSQEVRKRIGDVFLSGVKGSPHRFLERLPAAREPPRPEFVYHRRRGLHHIEAGLEREIGMPSIRQHGACVVVSALSCDTQHITGQSANLRVGSVHKPKAHIIIDQADVVDGHGREAALLRISQHAFLGDQVPYASLCEFGEAPAEAVDAAGGLVAVAGCDESEDGGEFAELSRSSVQAASLPCLSPHPLCSCDQPEPAGFAEVARGGVPGAGRVADASRVMLRSDLE